MKFFSLFILFFSLFPTLELDQEKKIKVLTPIQLEQKMRKEQRPIVIYYHTDWCKYCSVMEAGTLGKGNIIDSLNQHYYFVKFNPESTDSFKFFGRKYRYLKAEKYHEFKYVFDSLYAYPSLIFLSRNLELIETVVGYQKPKSFMKYLNAYKYK